jgi:hypothetical protein
MISIALLHEATQSHTTTQEKPKTYGKLMASATSPSFIIISQRKPRSYTEKSEQTLKPFAYYLHSLATPLLAAQLGTVKLRFGSLSHVTVPELDTLMNLYVTVCPGVILSVNVHTGLLDVYCAALSVNAEPVLQLPN